MSEISKEAWAEADAITGLGSGNAFVQMHARIAAALQRHVNEARRLEAEKESHRAGWRATVERAETAEARVKELEACLVRAEANGQEAHDATDLADVRRIKAEASKAALIREVREWWADEYGEPSGKQLRRILAKHEDGQ